MRIVEIIIPERKIITSFDYLLTMEEIVDKVNERVGVESVMYSVDPISDHINVKVNVDYDEERLY